MPHEANQIDPDWLSDGNSLVFGEAPSFSEGKPHVSGIHVLDLKTRRIFTLPASEGLWAVRVSLDGRTIVALSADASRLLLYDLTTHLTRELAKGANVG